MPTNAPELQTKVSAVTVSLLIALLVVGFFAGMNYSKMQATDELQKLNLEYTLAEIEGLRNDMNREVQLLRKEVDDLKLKVNGK